MEAVVESLLSNEYVRELAERGLDESEAIEAGISPGDWKTVEMKKKTPKSHIKRKAMKEKPITIVDVRQKQHARSVQANGFPLPDPWIQMSSLASHVASFLPPYPPSFFVSHFHDPNHGSPSAALRAAINTISESSTVSSPDPARTAILYGILDIIRASPEYESLTSEQKSTLINDTQISLSATEGRGEDAHDLVWLLYELDRDEESGNLGMGIYHSSPPSTPSSTHWTKPPVNPPQPPPPPAPVIQPCQPQTRKQIQDQYHWQTVPVRKPPQPYAHAAFIPSANPSNGRPGGNTYGKGDVGELDTRWKIRESVRKRNELLRQAAGAWKNGSKKSRGREVAAYFAERAREFQELAKKEQLENARIMVESKRYVRCSRC